MTSEPRTLPPSAADEPIFLRLALIATAMSFGGFMPTYWLQLPAQTFIGPPLLHLHAALYFAWPLLLVAQAWRARRGAMTRHRAWGVAGVALAAAMVVVGPAVAIHSLNHGLAAGYGDRSREFLIVPLSGLLGFVILLTAALLKARTNPAAHRRLMILATASLLGAATARVLFTVKFGMGPGLRPGLGAPPPLALATVASLIGDIPVVVGMLWDWRRYGRPNIAWLWGGALLLSLEALRAPVAQTAAWHALAQWLSTFGG